MVGVNLEVDSKATVCESCKFEKGMRKAIAKVRDGERCAELGDEIHSNLWGPSPVETLRKKRYYISFTDNYTRHTTVYFLHTRDEAFYSYCVYKVWLSTQYKVCIKCLNSD